MSAKDKQVGGGHYKDFAIQPVEFITRNNLGFLEGCVIKRMCRWQAKGGVEDLRKAIHEIELLIEEQPKQDTAPPDRLLAAQKGAPAANSFIPPYACPEGCDWPTGAQDGIRVLVWRPRKPLGSATQLYGWVEIGFMWGGELVPHGDVI